VLLTTSQISVQKVIAKVDESGRLNTNVTRSGNREIVPTRFLSQVRFPLSFQFRDFTYRLVIIRMNEGLNTTTFFHDNTNIFLDPDCLLRRRCGALPLSLPIFRNSLLPRLLYRPLLRLLTSLSSPPLPPPPLAPLPLPPLSPF